MRLFLLAQERRNDSLTLPRAVGAARLRFSLVEASPLPLRLPVDISEATYAGTSMTAVEIFHGDAAGLKHLCEFYRSRNPSGSAWCTGAARSTMGERLRTNARLLATGPNGIRSSGGSRGHICR